MFERIPEPPLDPPAPVLFCYCDECAREIYVGDYFFHLDRVYCERCVDRGRRLAE